MKGSLISTVFATLLATLESPENANLPRDKEPSHPVLGSSRCVGISSHVSDSIFMTLLCLSIWHLVNHAAMSVPCKKRMGS